MQFYPLQTSQANQESPVKNYFCSACGKSYTTKGNLGRHMKNECNVEPKFECVVCKRRFAHKFNLQRHLASGTCGSSLNSNQDNFQFFSNNSG